MPSKIIMPKVGLTVTEGELVKWLVQEGEPVSKGQPIAEVEADKATFQLESPADGTLARIVVAEGDIVAVTELVGWVAAAGEALPAEEGSSRGGARDADASPPAVRTDRPALGSELDGRSLQQPGAGTGTADDAGSAAIRKKEVAGRIKASPIARKLAKEAGLDLGEVRGTGAGGRIVLADVEAALAARPAVRAHEALAASPGRTVATERGTNSLPVAGVRRVISARMSESHRTTAPVTLTTEADATEFVRLRDELKAEAESRGDAPVSYTDVLVKVAAVALRSHPGVNARLIGKEIQRLSDINIGVAVDTDRGLLVPVVRRPDRKTVLEISRECRELAERVRSGANLPDDSTGGTFTITNLGMYDVDAFTPIINLPQCAILGAGRIKRQPVAVDNDILVRPLIWLSLTFDHRLIDGAPAARFLQHVKKVIEDPCALIL